MGAKRKQKMIAAVNFGRKFHGLLHLRIRVRRYKHCVSGHASSSRISIRMKAMAAAKCRLFATYWPSMASPMRKNLAVAQLLGDIEGADRGDEHHRDAGDDARQAQGPDDPRAARRGCCSPGPGRPPCSFPSILAMME